jgi:hypothetical protein
VHDGVEALAGSLLIRGDLVQLLDQLACRSDNASNASTTTSPGGSTVQRRPTVAVRTGSRRIFSHALCLRLLLFLPVLFLPGLNLFVFW